MKDMTDDFINRLFDVLDAIPVSIYLKDNEGKYVACNKYMVKMAGLSNRYELIGKNDEEFIWKDIASELKRTDQQVINNKIEYEGEEKPLIVNGCQRVFLTTKTPLFDQKKEVMGLMGVSVDITDRKKMEEELKQAKEKAEIASKAKTDFLLNMRHDMRTSLSGIQGFSELIKNESYEVGPFVKTFFLSV